MIRAILAGLAVGGTAAIYAAFLVFAMVVVVRAFRSGWRP